MQPELLSAKLEEHELEIKQLFSNFPNFTELPPRAVLALAVQMGKAGEMFSSNTPFENVETQDSLTGLSCSCMFFRQLMLPCKHIFHTDIYGSKHIITPQRAASHVAEFELRWSSLLSDPSCRSPQKALAPPPKATDYDSLKDSLLLRSRTLCASDKSNAHSVFSLQFHKLLELLEDAPSDSLGENFVAALSNVNV